ncbi:IDEAL domain-containing protein [Alkalihalophilus sp. As8PL]|uniref:IDEAL domain-containing protein n=1 Tax=Alkalihalophilus sp. As8PL TaxID=3237103 RepID=A0AB39BRT6_9BACI
MNNQFAMDNNIYRQLEIIKSLQKRTESTVQSLYAQAVLEYSMYHFKKSQLLQLIDESLEAGDKEAFYRHTLEYNNHVNDHIDGKMIIENGYELHLTFE